MVNAVAPVEMDMPATDYTPAKVKSWVKKFALALKGQREQRCRSLADKLFCAFKFGDDGLKTRALEEGILKHIGVAISPQASDILRYKAFRSLGQLCFGSEPRCRSIAEDEGIISALKHALGGTHKMTKLNALGTLNNLASFSSHAHIHLRYMAPLVLRALDGSWSDNSSSAKKIRGLCCKTLHNLACNADNHKYLLANRAIGPLVNVVARRSQELSFAVVAAALTICALASYQGSCPALATLEMCGASMGLSSQENVMVLMVRCLDAVLEDNPDPNDVNVFYKDWKIAQGLSVLTSLPERRVELHEAGLADMLHRGLSRNKVDPRFVEYALQALWNLQCAA